MNRFQLIILVVCLASIKVYSQNVIKYDVYFNEEKIEERTYNNDSLASVILFNASDTKDSLTLKDKELVSYHYVSPGYQLDSNSILPSLYWEYFYYNRSWNGYLSKIIKSSLLLEDIIGLVEDMDSTLFSDGKFGCEKRKIMSDGTKTYIKYSSINSRFHSKSLLSSFENENLRSFNIMVDNDLIKKIRLEGIVTIIDINLYYNADIIVMKKILFRNKLNNIKSIDVYNYRKWH